MFTLRCTEKLLKRMRLPASGLRGVVTPEHTTALGDWYAHLLVIQRQHLVLLVSEPSRLCILVPARDIDRLRPRFEHALMELLRAIGIPEEALLREARAMEQMEYGLTTGTASGRSVLGSMNDYTRTLRLTDLHGSALPDLNIYFAGWICGPLGYNSPADVARRLLCAKRLAVSE